jgi:hypothetical protein
MEVTAASSTARRLHRLLPAAESVQLCVQLALV